ncbi:hypothetical protein AXG93_872s1010 [Marchantia polymorpha subsp. ruderalis]|uniref:Uncharacterized protein n=1 Tax=Marchantia polymorpha subsp. ruderalis TaxID=1480154 RepID=A0A176VLD0_MARPO|nr:hypothetical protein AXG93_872s1010 [Marchantia polymorpha subsp. ruderalis]
MSCSKFLIQFADYATFLLLYLEQKLLVASSLLIAFGTTTGFMLNRHKCGIYWYAVHPPPTWLVLFGCTIAPLGSLSKLLDTPFEVSLVIAYVDQFLAAKISKKLKHWSSVHLSLAAKAVLMNYVLMSTLWSTIFGAWAVAPLTPMNALGKVRGILRIAIMDSPYQGVEMLESTS